MGRLSDQIYAVWEENLPKEIRDRKVQALLYQLSGIDRDVLKQLVTPVSDGNLISKQGRSNLVTVGLAARWNGLNFLTQDGYAFLDAIGYTQNNDIFKGGLPKASR
jgi:hypothetical protein